MNNKKAKALRAIARTKATQEGTTYLTKKTNHIFTDAMGNRMGYQTDQTVLSPNCAKKIAKGFKRLKALPEIWQLGGESMVGYQEGELRKAS